ncbi:MAG: hypothetical protein ACOX7U_02230 [Desulfitobacteriia bacterium]|jgi:hypothetical protein
MSSFRYVLYTFLALFLFIIFLRVLWLLIPILGLVMIAWLIYQVCRGQRLRNFKSSSNGTADEEKYTTVIDADNPDIEYKVRKFK